MAQDQDNATSFTLYQASVLRGEDNVHYNTPFHISSVRDLLKVNSKDFTMGEMVPTRKKSNWKRSNCLFIDVDTGLPIQDFKDKMRDYSYYICTSKSHQKWKDKSPPQDRYHVFFPLGTNILDRAHYESCLAKLITYFGSDVSCSDSSRFFFGNPLTEAYSNAGKSVSILLETLPDVGPVLKTTKDVSKPSSTPKLHLAKSPEQMTEMTTLLVHAKSWFANPSASHKVLTDIGMAMKNEGFDFADWETVFGGLATVSRWNGFHGTGKTWGTLSYYTQDPKDIDSLTFEGTEQFSSLWACKVLCYKYMGRIRINFLNSSYYFPDKLNIWERGSKSVLTEPLEWLRKELESLAERETKELELTSAQVLARLNDLQGQLELIPDTLKATKAITTGKMKPTTEQAKAMESLKGKIKAVTGCLKNLSSSRGIEDVIRLLEFEGVDCTEDDFNKSEVLATKNGWLYDFTERKWRRIELEDHVSMVANADYDPNAGSPTNFVAHIEGMFTSKLDGKLDVELMEYLMKVLGYSCLRTNKEQKGFFLHDNGRTGKGTLMEKVVQILGGHATSKDSKLLDADLNNDRDKYSIVGKRLIHIEELEEGQTLDNGFFKHITGLQVGGKLELRRLYGELESNEIYGKIVCTTNHRPRVKDTTDSIWERIKVIEIPGKQYTERSGAQKQWKIRDFESEDSGILNALVEWAVKYLDEGLKTPSSMSSSIDDYRTSENPLSDWLENCVNLGRPDKPILLNALYKSYQNYCDVIGTRKTSISLKKFKDLLEKVPTMLMKKVSAGQALVDGIKSYDVFDFSLEDQTKDVRQTHIFGTPVLVQKNSQNSANHMSFVSGADWWSEVIGKSAN